MRDSSFGAMIAAIEPADGALGARARQLLCNRGRGVDSASGMIELAARLAAATRSLDVALRHRHLVICAADHGVDSPDGRVPRERAQATQAALAEVASGRAAVAAIARSADGSMLVVDCGTAADAAPERGVMELAVLPGTADICRGPAMSVEAAELALHTGIALMISIADSGCDCLALGQLAPGSQAVSTALIAHLLAIPIAELEPEVRDVVARAFAANPLAEAAPLDVLAALGGCDIGVLCGLVLAAASLRIPVVLDDRATAAAALLAARMAPASASYLIASHAGTSLVHRRALEALGLTAIFDMALSHGEGAGSAAALPVLATAAHLLRDHASR